MKNKFIVFEGIEACGKSTQLNFLADYLRNKGEKVWVTAEPSTSEIGKTIRYYLQHGGLDNKTMSLLFAADRSLHVKEIKEHLNNGEWVLCDRYIGSSLAYQNYLEDPEVKMSINAKFLMPDITFYFNISTETSISRIKARGGVEECFDKKEVLERVKKRYEDLYLLRNHPIICIIDGEKDIKKVTEQVINGLEKSLKRLN